MRPMSSGRPFLDVQQLVKELLQETIVVGHALNYDVKVCGYFLYLPSAILLSFAGELAELQN